MRVLVTGSTGFIGFHLTNRLVSDDREVHVIVRPSSNLNLLNNIKDKIVIHEHDGTTFGILSIIERSKPVIVFHLASVSPSQHAVQDIDSLIKSNVLFGNQLVEAMVKKHVYYLINTGTYWQHYQNKDYSPVCLYAATKQAFEAILQFYTETTAIKVITLKLFDTYGPNDPRPKLFNQLKKAIERNESLDVSPGDQLIDVVYISDIIEAYVVSAKRLLNGIGNKSEEFAISSGKPIHLKELVKKYLQIVEKKVDIRWGGRNYRSREVMIPWDKGNMLPGWKPLITIEEGIRSMEGI